MQRNRAIDLARGFTVLFIPVIHSVMLYSKFEVHHSLFGNLLAFIAEWPGAQIFMLLMGVSLPLSKSSPPKKVLRKAFILLTIAYLMNYLKFILPIEIGVMPKEFLREYANGNFSKLDFFLTGDILQFAAIALIVLLIVSQFQHSALIALYLAVLILLASPLLWDLRFDDVFANHLLSLFFGKPPESYFPVFPWLLYPLTGFAIGTAIKEKYQKLYRDLFITGVAIVAVEYLVQFSSYHFPATSFYRTYPDVTLIHLGFAVAWFSMWHFISKKFSGGKFFSLLQFSSRNITLIYFIQWILIFWCFPLFGYHRLALGMSILVPVSITATVFLITFAINKLLIRKQKTSTLSKPSLVYEP